MGCIGKLVRSSVCQLVGFSPGSPGRLDLSLENPVSVSAHLSSGTQSMSLVSFSFSSAWEKETHTGLLSAYAAPLCSFNKRCPSGQKPP